MGNCLVLEHKMIKIMKMDGKILEYKAPLQVHQVLSEFADHAISDELPVHRHLPSNTKMQRGRLYYLLPPPLPSSNIDGEVSNESNPMVEPDQETGVVRIKMVITKQELKELLAKGGLSVDQLISQLQNKPSTDGVAGDANERYRGWKPALKSIPEGSDYN